MMSENTNGKSPFTVWWFTAGGFLILALIAGIAIGLFAGRDNDEEQAGPEQGATVAVPQPVNGDGKCSLPADDQDYPTQGPEAEWTMFMGVVGIPESETYGPQAKDGEQWECFAHSPTGALFAGAYQPLAFDMAGITEVAASDPASQSLAEEKGDLGARSAAPSSTGQFTGFKFLSYTEDTASIEYLLQQDDIVGSLTINLTWDAEVDDWRLDLSNGEPAFDDSPTEEQFTPWGMTNG